MSDLSERQRAAILQLNAEYRLAHFRRALQEQQVLYIVTDGDGPCLLEDRLPDSDGVRRQVLPVFSHACFAEHYIGAQALAGAQARAVSLEAFRSHWQPFLSEHGIMLGVMPVAEDCCVLDALDEA